MNSTSDHDPLDSLPETGWNATTEELNDTLETHPLFADEIREDNPDMQAIQALLKETSPEELAENLKESGNQAVKLGKNRYKDAIIYYTQALSAHSSDNEVNSSIYSNRALVNQKLENHGSCIRDCRWAIKLNPKNLKAYYRSAVSMRKLRKHNEAIKICKQGLEEFPSQKDLIQLLKINKKELALLHQKECEREELKLQQKNALKNEEVFLMRRIHEKGYQINQENVYNIPQQHVHSAQTWYDKEKDEIHFPVLFIYEEYRETDFIVDFAESERFASHLSTMFPPSATAPPWDVDKKYTTSDIELYYEVKNSEKYVLVNPKKRLKQVLKLKDFVIFNIPVFYIVVKNSDFKVIMMARHKQ